MRAYILGRLRTFDGEKEVRGEWVPVTEAMIAGVEFMRDILSGPVVEPVPWLSVDATYPDGTERADYVKWIHGDGIQKAENDGSVYRPRCGPESWIGPWTTEHTAELQWMEAAREFEGLALYWAVVDRKAPDGTVTIHRTWAASDQANVSQPPVAGRRRGPGARRPR